MLGQGKKFSLNEGWEVSYGDNVLKDVDLPQKLDVQKNQKIFATVTIPS